MTKDPLDLEERAVWLNGAQGRTNFHAALRLDRILWGWPAHWKQLASQGYAVDDKAPRKSIAEIRRFLADSTKRMRPVYMAVSLPGEFFFPHGNMTGRTLREPVLPLYPEYWPPLS